MKNLFIFITIFAITAFASILSFAIDVNYDCENQNTIDLALPLSVYVQIEGNSVSLQDNSNDLYHKGYLTNHFEGQNMVATGFESLILASDGRVLISKAMLKGKKKATLTVIDDALDSTYNEYSCKKLD